MSKRVITVDDSKTMRDMVHFTLRRAGYDVLEAEDGELALTTLGQNDVNLVTINVNMPNMDGITLVKRLRCDHRHRHLPILILTTETDATLKDEGRAAGATGWLVKPIEPENQLKVVRRVCG